MKAAETSPPTMPTSPSPAISRAGETARIEGTLAPAPLAGVRVLDLTQVVAGPFCTTMLADMGADIVKVERPDHGDDLRTVSRYPGREDHEDYFNANNRSKRSIALDLKLDADRDVAHALARKANVVVENFAPGTAARLGMDWKTLKAINPRLVYCSISGFGQTGPYRSRLALDPVIQAVAGNMSVTGEPDGRPLQVGAPLADVLAGIFGAYAIVALLRAVERDGVGRFTDISMQAAMVAALGPRMGETLQANRIPQRMGNENPMRVPADAYSSADDRYVSIICQNQRHWEPLCHALDRADMIHDPRFATPTARLSNRAILNSEIARVMKQKTAAEWVARLDAQRVPCARVNDYREALEDPQIIDRGLIHTLDHPTAGRIRVVGPPWIIEGVESPMFPPPRLGEHSREVLADWLGHGVAAEPD
jgi:crotonobetainyl-CoA:carnitine CoA-transferase CaiB-like acyl-CoA transferase